MKPICRWSTTPVQWELLYSEVAIGSCFVLWSKPLDLHLKMLPLEGGGAPHPSLLCARPCGACSPRCRAGREVGMLAPSQNPCAKLGLLTPVACSKLCLAVSVVFQSGCFYKIVRAWKVQLLLGAGNSGVALILVVASVLVHFLRASARNSPTLTLAPCAVWVLPADNRHEIWKPGGWNFSHDSCEHSAALWNCFAAFGATAGLWRLNAVSNIQS